MDFEQNYGELCSKNTHCNKNILRRKFQKALYSKKLVEKKYVERKIVKLFGNYKRSLNINRKYVHKYNIIPKVF